MGQWSHRRRRGGTHRGLNFITRATIHSATAARLTFAYPPDPADVAALNFQSQLSELEGDSVAQVDPSTFDIDFAGSIETDTFLEHEGEPTVFITPQSINYT